MSEKYFLGAMTQNGFSTEFGKIMADKEYFTFILKGGAGTGKSSLMKKIAAEFEPTEDAVSYTHLDVYKRQTKMFQWRSLP